MSDINHNRMIPLHIADQAVAACEKEIAGLKAESARLKAEVEAYRSASDEVAAAFLVLPTPHNQVARVCEGIESLKAEVERLRKAGDILLLALWLGVDEYSKEQKEKAEEEWNAANREQGCLVNPIKVAQYLPKPPTKEGKQP